MFGNIFRNYVLPVSTLAGSIIGVGFFALPYVAMKAGIWIMLAYFLVVGGLVLLIHLIFGKISLATPDYKRFPGFAEFYLGRWGKAISLASVLFGSVGVLLIYLIVGGQFLTSIFQPVFGGDFFPYTLIYFSLASAAIYFGIRAVSKIEFSVIVFLFASLFLILISGFSQIKLSNIFLPASGLGDWKAFFLPYGAVMFSLWGTGMIPEVEEMLGKKKKIIKKVIAASILTAAVFYLSFIFLILGITGQKTTESALSGLKNFLGHGAVLICLSAGVMSTFNGFIALGLTLKKVLIYDMGVKKNSAFIITCFTPWILFSLGLKSFIPLVSFIGGFLLGIDGILILLMYQKIACLPAGRVGKNITIWVLSFVFILGIIYEIVYFVKN